MRQEIQDAFMKTEQSEMNKLAYSQVQEIVAIYSNHVVIPQGREIYLSVPLTLLKLLPFGYGSKYNGCTIVPGYELCVFCAGSEEDYRTILSQRHLYENGKRLMSIKEIFEKRDKSFCLHHNS